MSAIELAPEIAQDVSRILAHLAQFEVQAADQRVLDIVAALVAALDILENSPLIGRPTANDLRELVIGRGSRGYVALYRYVSEIDTVFILAIRSQREAGYRE